MMMMMMWMMMLMMIMLVRSETAIKCLCLCVEGPNTVCRCNIERLQDGRRKVTYTPVEVGIFTVTITWNCREIPGNT